MKQLKFISKIFYGMIVVFLLVTASAVIISYLGIPTGFKLFTVQSGSMEPTIKTGSVILSQPKSNYQTGDIITFTKQGSKDSVTHRVYQIQDNQFITKGDANNAPDGDPIDKSMVLGKVLYTVPYLGYPISFARTQTGLIILIIIPATLIIYSELLNIKNEIVKILKAKNENKGD